MLSYLFFISILSSFAFTPSHTQCLDHQKSSLLDFKNGLSFNSSISTKLVQWNQTDHDCCKWHGVACDGAGNVVSLQLDSEGITGRIGDSSTLFRLKHLEKLNLAYNSFDYAPIPKGIHNLTYLTHLNLSNAGFGEQVPLEITMLKRLASLDLSNNLVTLESPNLETLVRNLTGLTELYLDGIFMSSDESSKWSHIISSNLPHLKSLSLNLCSLSGPLASSFWKLGSLSVLRLDGNDLSQTVPSSFSGFSNLTSLSLNTCNLKGSFPSTIFQIPTLQNLDLSYNFQLRGSIPPFPRNGSLESLKVRMTNFSGSIPSSIGNLESLSELDLSTCNFTGPIPSTFASLTRLVYVNLRNNMLTGSLPSSLFEGLSSLVHLDLGNNSFTGNIPRSIFDLPSLERLWLENNFTGQVEELTNVSASKIATLHLGGNRLEGPIPNSFFQLRSLKSLVLSRNLFNGSFQLDKIRNLPNLTTLNLSYNNLSIDYKNGKSSRYRLSKLQELGLASCNLYDFPDFVQHSDMRILDLSKNRISGEIPSWIWGRQLESLNLSFNLLTELQKPYYIPPSLQLLDLHANRLKAELNLLIPLNTTLDLSYLLIANNSFSGSIPTSLCNAANLDFLYLSVNELSGSIPPCLLESIQVVDLGQNNINGRILSNFSTDCYLRYLNLNNNALEGKIPESLERCMELEFMNVGNNMIDDTFPCMLSSSSMRVLVLSSNRFHGDVIRCNNSWPLLQILDVSSNNFSGSLELINFSSWRAMVAARSESRQNKLSYYSLWSFGVTLTIKGLGVELVKIWPDFTTLDFSSNKFAGEIPDAIGDLTSLRLLNISNNAMNGSIPKPFGKLRWLESLDLSRNKLTGAIPSELGGLTFLSFLNVSYNELVGEIPKGRQLQTFSGDSFRGNPGLCGLINLNTKCGTSSSGDEEDEEEEEEEREIEWKYVAAALGYVVGLGSILLVLVFCRRFREKWFDRVDDVIEKILDAGNMMRIYARRLVN